MILDQVVYGDSPEPGATGFVVLALSPGVNTADLVEIERKTNVGQWLASQQQAFIHHELRRLPSGRLSFSIIVPSSTRFGRRTIGLNLLLSDEQFQAIGDPFLAFAMDTPLFSDGIELTLRDLLDAGRYRGPRLPLTVEPIRLPVPADVSSLATRLSTMQGQWTLGQWRSRAALFYSTLARGFPVVLPLQSHDEGSEELLRLLWLALPNADRTRVTFATHASPTRSADFQAMVVPQRYLTEQGMPSEYVLLTQSAADGYPASPEYQVFAEWLYESMPAEHAEFVRTLDSCGDRWLTRPESTLIWREYRQLLNGLLPAEGLSNLFARADLPAWISPAALADQTAQRLASDEEHGNLDSVVTRVTQILTSWKTEWSELLLAKLRALLPASAHQGSILVPLLACGPTVVNRFTWQALDMVDPNSLQWLAMDSSIAAFRERILTDQTLPGREQWRSLLFRSWKDGVHTAAVVDAASRLALDELSALVPSATGRTTEAIPVWRILLRRSVREKRKDVIQWVSAGLGELTGEDPRDLILEAVNDAPGDAGDADLYFDNLDRLLALPISTTRRAVVAERLARLIKQRSDEEMAAKITAVGRPASQHLSLWKTLLQEGAILPERPRVFVALLNLHAPALTAALHEELLRRVIDGPLPDDGRRSPLWRITARLYAASESSAGLPGHARWRLGAGLILSGLLHPREARRWQAALLKSQPAADVLSWMDRPRWRRLDSLYPAFTSSLAEVLCVSNESAAELLVSDEPEVFRGVYRALLARRSQLTPKMRAALQRGARGNAPPYLEELRMALAGPESKGEPFNALR